MNNELKKEFPAFVIREQKQEKIATAFSMSLRRCQGAYAALKGMPDIGEVPGELSVCMADIFNKHVDEVIEKIKSEVTMTQAVKEDTIAEWEQVRSEALEQVSIISRFLSAYPQAEIEVRDSSVECLNSVDLVNDLSKEAVPEGCEQHYALIREAAEVLTRLYTYQKENGVNLPDVQFLRFVDDPEGLAKLWLNAKEMQKFKESLSQASGVVMANGMTVAEANEKHRQKMLQQAQERAKLKQNYNDRREVVEEVQLSAIPPTIN